MSKTFTPQVIDALEVKSVVNGGGIFEPPIFIGQP